MVVFLSVEAFYMSANALFDTLFFFTQRNGCVSIPLTFQKGLLVITNIVGQFISFNQDQHSLHSFIGESVKKAIKTIEEGHRLQGFCLTFTQCTKVPTAGIHIHSFFEGFCREIVRGQG